MFGLLAAKAAMLWLQCRRLQFYGHSLCLTLQLACFHYNLLQFSSLRP